MARGPLRLADRQRVRPHHHADAQDRRQREVARASVGNGGSAHHRLRRAAYISDAMLRGHEDEISARALYAKHFAPVRMRLRHERQMGLHARLLTRWAGRRRRPDRGKSRGQKFQVQTSASSSRRHDARRFHAAGAGPAAHHRTQVVRPHQLLRRPADGDHARLPDEAVQSAISTPRPSSKRASTRSWRHGRGARQRQACADPNRTNDRTGDVSMNDMSVKSSSRRAIRLER
jgi:hypothetical protein